MFEVCQTGPCMLNGSDDIIKYIDEKLGIKPGETTERWNVYLENSGMSWRLWLCADDADGKNYREHLTKEKVDAIIEECRKNAVQQIITMKKSLQYYICWLRNILMYSKTNDPGIGIPDARTNSVRGSKEQTNAWRHLIVGSTLMAYDTLQRLKLNPRDEAIRESFDNMICIQIRKNTLMI